MSNPSQTSTRPNAARRITRCPACGRREKRSLEQNARYWKLVTKVSEEYAPDGKYFGKEAWHWQLCKYFIGARDEFLPDGSVLIVPESSSDLEPPEFSEFMTAVEAWAANRGVWLDE